MNSEDKKELDRLANLIRQEMPQYLESERAVSQHMIELGKNLILLKNSLPPEQFKLVVQNDFDMNLAEAEMYINSVHPEIRDR